MEEGKITMEQSMENDCGNFTSFALEACQKIEDGEPPFLNGSYRPESSFLGLNGQGTNPNGIGNYKSVMMFQKMRVR